MSREILIQKREAETRVAVLEDGKLDDFHIEAEHYQSILGNIYKGRVESILPSINGAFVNIGKEKNGFLYLTDAVNPMIEEEENGPRKFFDRLFNRNKENKDNKEKPDQPAAEQQPQPTAGQEKDKKPQPQQPIPLKEGQEILVQVVKDPFSTKGARLTTHISLAGRFVVYMPFDDHSGVSKKIENHEERVRLKNVLKEFSFARRGGFIVRTASLSQGAKELTRDAKFLYRIWSQIVKLSEKKQAPSLIYKEYDLIWRVVRDYFSDKVNNLIIDSYDDFVKIRKFVHTLVGKPEVSKVHFYKGHIPLFKAKNVSEELDKIYDTKVVLKSGAYVVIEQTEGLTVVDVNSGKFRTKAAPEEAAFMVNLEAAPEIARQLRLRDVGGIIVIDFIDMSREGHKRRVLEALELGLERDYAKTEVNKISALGLVEMTRARTGKTLEAISFGPCPYCDGRGKVKIN